MDERTFDGRIKRQCIILPITRTSKGPGLYCIVICQINGISDVVTLKKKAAYILREFYNHQKSSDIEKEKIVAAAELIKSEIKELIEQSANYPSIADVEQGLEYIPTTLLLLLRKAFVFKGSAVKQAAIGQTIMQAVRPRAITAPLRIGLAIQMYKLYGSRLLIESLHNLGFCSSYSEVERFERSAALHQGIEGMNNDSFLQYVAANVDHNLRTIDGLNTFHGMGIITLVTPGVPTKRPVLKVTLSPSQIIEMGRIETHMVLHTGKKSMKKYKTLSNFNVPNAGDITLLWKCTLLLKPERPLWNGFTWQTSHMGDHPDVSSVIFMPMIDSDAYSQHCTLL